MVARIYRPSKTAMQSGKAKTENWVLDFDPEAAKTIEPLMGYTASSDMRQQVRMTFHTKEEAIAYAQRNKIPYRVIEKQPRKVRPASYSDNFRHDRAMPWTH